MLITKIRSMIALSTVAIALASSGAASAATVTGQPSNAAPAPPTATTPIVEYPVLLIATFLFTLDSR